VNKDIAAISETVSRFGMVRGQLDRSSSPQTGTTRRQT
jgi:hypothetical protein